MIAVNRMTRCSSSSWTDLRRLPSGRHIIHESNAQRRIWNDESLLFRNHPPFFPSQMTQPLGVTGSRRRSPESHRQRSRSFLRDGFLEFPLTVEIKIKVLEKVIKQDRLDYFIFRVRYHCVFFLSGSTNHSSSWRVTPPHERSKAKDNNINNTRLSRKILLSHCPCCLLILPSFLLSWLLSPTLFLLLSCCFSSSFTFFSPLCSSGFTFYLNFLDFLSVSFPSMRLLFLFPFIPALSLSSWSFQLCFLSLLPSLFFLALPVLFQMKERSNIRRDLQKVLISIVCTILFFFFM